jgi:WD40 repeat protein
VLRFAISADGNLLASGSYDGTVRLWDIPGRALLKTFRGFKSSTWAVAFSRDGKYFAASSEEGLCQIWEPSTGKKLRAFNEKNALEGLVFLPDNRLLVGGWPGLLREYSIENDVVLQLVRLSLVQPTSLQTRTDGRLVICAGYGGAVQLWDWTPKRPQRQTIRLFPHHTWLPGATFSPDGRHFATANPDGTVYVFRLADSGKPLPGLSRPDVILQPEREFGRRGNEIHYVAFSHDGARAFSACGRNVRVWDVAKGTQLFSLDHPHRVVRLAVSPEDGALVTACDDEIVRFWDVTTGKESRRLEGQHGAWWLAMSPDGSEIMTDHDGSTIISSFKTGAELRRFPAIGNAWTPDGKHLLGHRGVHDANTGSIVTPISGHRAWLRDVTVSPDGSLGLTCSGWLGNGQSAGWGADCSARLWDLRTGQELRCWQETSFTRWGAAFTPGGRRAVVGSHDGTIRVYDIATGKELACLESPVGIIGVAVSPDGRSVIGGCCDGVLRLWRLPDDIADPPIKALPAARGPLPSPAGSSSSTART